MESPTVPGVLRNRVDVAPRDLGWWVMEVEGGWCDWAILEVFSSLTGFEMV